MDAFTPQQTIELIARLGCKKSHMRLDKLFWNSFMAGPLLGFGCAVLVSTNAAPWYQDNAPGLIRMVGALLFPVGLVMITLSGADLWTTNIMYMITAYLARRISIMPLLISWTVSYIGNLAGSLFFMAIICGYGGLFDEASAYKESAIRIATQKCATPAFHQIFLRAIGANWLVCFAVYSAMQSREVASKIIAIWWPTATFVALALDHTIANMFFIPMGIWLGADINVGTYIWKSMIASSLGNVVGGGVFVGATYWYLYLTGEAAVSINFNIGAEETAVEGGAGPLRLRGHDPEDLRRDGGAEHVGEQATDGSMFKSPSHGGGTQLVSGVAKDLSDDSEYAKTYMEREGNKDTMLKDGVVNGGEKV